MTDEVEQAALRANLERLYGSIPWLKAKEAKRYRVRVFKSGNSVAVRLPAALGLTPGIEMELDVEDNVFLSLTPVDQPKRKFNIAKVAGSARDLRFIDREDRLFEERPLHWGGPEADPQPGQ